MFKRTRVEAWTRGEFEGDRWVRLIMSVTAWRSHSREHGDDRGRNWGWFWAAAEGRFCETVARECCPGGLKAHQADRG